ncbi:MAG: hypothetical protein JO336_06800 [Acidobacteriia bacterium]|nr:hypothetical protein [Terriglobia bacterium]
MRFQFGSIGREEMQAMQDLYRHSRPEPLGVFVFVKCCGVMLLEIAGVFERARETADSPRGLGRLVTGHNRSWLLVK